MGESKGPRVQQESADQIALEGWRVEVVSENRMPDRLQMDPQLMRAAGERCELEAGAIVQSLEHLEAGDRVFPLLVIDDLAGTVVDVGPHRKIDDASIRNDSARHDGNV